MREQIAEYKQSINITRNSGCYYVQLNKSRTSDLEPSCSGYPLEILTFLITDFARSKAVIDTFVRRTKTVEIAADEIGYTLVNFIALKMELDPRSNPLEKSEYDPAHIETIGQAEPG